MTGRPFSYSKTYGLSHVTQLLVGLSGSLRDHSQRPSPRDKTFGNMPIENGIALQCAGQSTLDSRHSSVGAMTSSVGGNVSDTELHGWEKSTTGRFF